jgi:cell wall-associated NlpC family hydrolase
LRRNFARGVMAMMVLVAALTAVPAMAATKRYGTRTLRMGTQGKDVKTMQKYLTKVGIKTTADGEFGSGTKKKAKTFEKRYHQTVNGVLSKKEQRVLKQSALGTSTDAASPDPEPVTPTTTTVPGEKATLNADGTATAPADAPQAVKDIIAAGNEIYNKPYHYGGGHGKWNDSGYDCSGSVSYVLHAAGLLKTSRDSTGFETYGKAGRGKWVSIYANSGHAWMRVAGLRFDTSGQSADGSRWHATNRSASSYVIRHVSGL